MRKSIHTTTTLINGVEIPYLGLGTWQSRGRSCEKAVTHALSTGYTMIDTAQAYANEVQVGKGWKASGRDRGDIFITTKISNSNQGYHSARKSFEESLKNLQTDFVDLLLIHWPEVKHFSKTVDTWRALIELQDEGLCRSIGISNFTIALTEKLLSEIDVIPAVNQVEFHTFLYQRALLEYCREKNIQLEAYSPIARGKFFGNQTLQRIADRHQKTAAQVMLAWLLQHDLVVIPKSVNEQRIDKNADIFFVLDDDDMDALNNMEPQTRLVDGYWAPDW